MINDGKGPGGSTLLCFAHKGEAQSFLQAFPFQPHQRFQDVWSTSDLTLCLTGEGIDQAMSKVALLLGAHPEITKVINLGVAGAIRPDVELHQVISVQSVYGEDRFHSFELSGDVDVLTTQERILDERKAQKLRAFAPVIDRELWGIARACKEARVKLEAVKLISDIVGPEQKDLCMLVKENAPFFSEQLYIAYQKINDLESKSLTDKNKMPVLIQNQHFHFSKFQQRQVTKLLEQVEGQKNQIDKIIFKIEQLKKRPKDRARLFIEELNQLLFPLESYIKDSLQELKNKDLQRGIEVQFDSQLEELELQIKVKASDQHQWQQNLKALESLNLKRYWNVLKGELDV